MVIQTFIAVGRGLRRAGDIEVSQEDIQTLRQLDVRIKELEKRLKLYTLNVRNLHCIYMAIRNSSLHSIESSKCICSICIHTSCDTERECTYSIHSVCEV